MINHRRLECKRSPRRESDRSPKGRDARLLRNARGSVHESASRARARVRPHLLHFPAWLKRLDLSDESVDLLHGSEFGFVGRDDDGMTAPFTLGAAVVSAPRTLRDLFDNAQTPPCFERAVTRHRLVASAMHASEHEAMAKRHLSKTLRQRRRPISHRVRVLTHRATLCSICSHDFWGPFGSTRAIPVTP